jgi:hypothetical protein
MLRQLDQIGAPIRGHRRKSHPATIPRTLPFTSVRRRVDNSLTCPDDSPESAGIRLKHVRNVEVGGSSPLTSTTSSWERGHGGVRTGGDGTPEMAGVCMGAVGARVL